MEFLYPYAWLIPAFPLLAATISGIGLISLRQATLTLRWRIAYFNIFLLGLSFLLSVGILVAQINQKDSYQWLLEWIVTRDFSLDIGYVVDPLTSVMLVLVTSVALLVMIYSDSYMSYDQGYVRFFVYLSLFTTSMLGLVLSPNLVQVYIFWELVGMCSYLLIGFWFTRPAAAEACQKAFITNRVGDFGFFLGILGLYWATGSFEFDTISDRLTTLLDSEAIDKQLAILFCLLVFLGPMAKSAQFPLHVWLPDAMEGPTPISALIHAATMVAAGIFLVARMFPIFNQLSSVMEVIAWVGAVTALIAAIIAVSQVDVKKGLAYSTMSQLGYMMMAMGIGSYSAGLFHLLTHAYSKALLFLGSGSIIHGMEPVLGFNPAKNQNMLFMGKVRQYMPITSITFFIGTLSLCGIPPLACFWSKDEILSQAFAANPLLWFIGWSTAGLTSFYMFRIYFLVFEGNEFRAHTVFANIPNDVVPKESNAKMVFPLIVLSFFTIFIGFLGTPFNNLFEEFLEDPAILVTSHHEFDITEFSLMVFSSVGIALIGVTVASLLYKDSKIAPSKIIEKIMFLSKLSSNKFYVDAFYENVFLKGNRFIAKKTLQLDQQIVDGVVNLSGFITLLTGESLRYIENGRVQSYLFVILLSICGSVLLFNKAQFLL